MLNDYIYINHKKTAYRVIDSEATVVNLKNSTFNTLNPVATFIWLRLDGQKQVKTIIQELCDEFNVDYMQAEKDCLEFLKSLQQENLVTISSEPVKES